MATTRKTKAISFGSDDLLDRIEADAAARRETVSEWVRWAALLRLDRPNVELPRASNVVRLPRQHAQDCKCGVCRPDLTKGSKK